MANAGTTPGNEACSFEFRTEDSIPLASDGSFLAVDNEGVQVEVSGRFEETAASGTAIASGLPSIDRCTLLQWTARPATQ